MFEQLKSALQSMGVIYAEAVDGREALRLPFSTPNGRWSTSMALHRPLDLVICLSSAPDRVPEERRPAMAMLLAEMNYSQAYGCWEMDPADGEVRLRTVMHCPDRCRPEEVAFLLGGNVTLFHEMLPRLAQVIAGPEPEAVGAELTAARQRMQSLVAQIEGMPVAAG